MKTSSLALLRAFAPFTRLDPISQRTPACLAQNILQQTSQFSTSQPRPKKNAGPKRDKRITQIRYHLQHPLTPRPLRFSRNRALRHWTIHRAWQRYTDKLRTNRELELERQYNAMAAACEALRLIDNRGMNERERQELGAGAAEDEGRLYRIAMRKDNGVWDGAPIEYARIQTDTPGREGWNHAWKR